MFFYNILKATITQRQTGQVERRNDLIDLMLDAIKKEDVPNCSIDANGNESTNLTDKIEQDSKLNHRSEKRLTDINIIATAMIIFVAGII